MQYTKPSVLVIYGYGINCQEETLFAFCQAGFTGKILHINELRSENEILKSYQVFAIPGGFSFADQTGSGNAFALKMPQNLIQEFLAAGKLVIGICNGAQILTRILKNYQVTLLKNDSNTYQCEWVEIEVQNKNCVWLNEIEEIKLPIAHAEGKFFARNTAIEKLIAKNQIAMTYKNNPNGSIENIAAITDETGRLLITMPHPERAIFFHQQENWPFLKEYNKRNEIQDSKFGPGSKIFANAYKYFT